jgi:hypothetical protein
MAGETLPSGSTNTQGLADWAAPYITNYLGKAQALSETPYQTYGGPLTAGASNLQNKAFTGLAGLTFPSNFGQSFSSAGAPTIGAGGQPVGGGGVAQSYMNPYLQSVLNPQLDELRRQNEITNMNANAKLTGQGAFGGGRQAIMNAENNRNLMQEMNKTVGQGYANAYDKAMSQFNTEQGQGRDLTKLMTDIGGIERGITSEGVAADLSEFEKQRQYPFQQVQFQRDMISGLPAGSVTNTPGQLTGIGALLSALGGGAAAAKAFGYKDISELLKGLGLNTGSETP